MELVGSSFLDWEVCPSALVPRDYVPNLRFRQRLLAWCNKSKANQQLVTNACARDPLFFTNAFVWVSDVKRHPDAPNRAFIAWPFQEEVLLEMDASIGRKSVGIIKSRDLGGSTMPLIVFDRRLLFVEDQTLMVMSRNEKLVDDPRNPDSLFAKLDNIHKWLPSFMTSCLSRYSLTLTNSKTGSNIIGSSTSGDAGRGGRKQAVLVDEFAAFDRKESFDILGSLQHNTKCRIYNSTPKGIGNGFHEVITQGNIKVFDLSWEMHPVHGAGLYQGTADKLDLLDKPYWETKTANQILYQYPELEKKFPPSDELAIESYDFILDGKIRSPYYDYECLLCPIPKLIGQELDRDFIGSGSPFFDMDGLKDYTATFAQNPLEYGELTWDEDYEKVNWAKDEKNGRLQLWFHPNLAGKPIPGRRYVIGVDIAAGTGASNSHISVGDCASRSKVAGFTTAHLRPEKFAEYVFAVGKWFNDAQIVFEGGGVGSDFGGRIKELGYPNLFYFTKTSGKRSEKPGWFPTGDLKRNLLTEYGRALTMREFTNRDRVAIDECQMYEFTATGLVAHVSSHASSDPSGAKSNHGDRVIADALCWMLLKRSVRPESEEVAGLNSLATLQKEEARFESRNGSWSPRDNPRPWCLVKR